MSGKEKIKKLLGRNNIVRLKKTLGVKKYIIAAFNGRVGKFTYDANSYELLAEIKLKNKHVFFGYYDILQLNEDGDKALVHIIDRKADPARDKATLAWYGLSDGKLHPFSETSAWSWQQGARLRWHPVRKDSVIYNDFTEDGYVTKIYELSSGRESVLAKVPLYDIAPDGKLGLSVNFDRLQRLRPGYGYSCRLDPSVGIAAPEGDGIFVWDMSSSSLNRIVDLQALSQKVEQKDVEHYINHISISPDGRRFMFFHLWSQGQGLKWKTNLYICDMDGSHLTLVDDSEIISHYDWYGNDALLTTALPNETTHHAKYMIYDLKRGSKQIIDDQHLTKDGHPTWINGTDRFISDTYPQSNSMQYIFRDALSGDQYEEIVSVYADPFSIEEKRCDLHPRIDQRHNCISFDTTYTGVRSIVILKER